MVYTVCMEGPARQANLFHAAANSSAAGPVREGEESFLLSSWTSELVRNQLVFQVDGLLRGACGISGALSGAFAVVSSSAKAMPGEAVGSVPR